MLILKLPAKIRNNIEHNGNNNMIIIYWFLICLPFFVAGISVDSGFCAFLCFLPIIFITAAAINCAFEEN